jgi:hypothetical protein
MLQRDVRLGDDIDDYCVRCKRVMNHAVVSVLGGVAAKVRCRTCHSDHDFRHEQPPPPKVDSRKAALFQEVLKTVDPSAAAEVGDDEALDAVETAEGAPEAEALESGDSGESEEATAAAAPGAPKGKASKAPPKAAKGKAKAKK